MAKTKEVMISFNELHDLEEMVYACAASALRIARLSKCKHADTVKPKVNDNTVSTLMDCYARSAFSIGHYVKIQEAQANESEEEVSASTDDKAASVDDTAATQPKTKYQKYMEYIQHNFLAAVSKYAENCESQNHLDLVLPILFFSLILQNESNSESVSRRALKIELEGIHSTPWKSQNPFKLSGHKIKAKAKQRLQFQNSVYSLETLAIRKSYYSHPMLVPEVNQAMTCAFHIAEEYDKVSFFSEQARIGAFLLDILDKTASKEKPVNTILRMYMVKQMHNVLDWTRLFDSADPLMESQKDGLGLLLRFFMDEGAPRHEVLSWGKLPLYYKGKLASPNTREILDSNLAKQDHFATYYRILRNDFNWEIAGFIDFYLNKDTLEKYIEADRAVLKYTRAMKHFIKQVSKLEDAYHAAGVISDLDDLLNAFRKEEDVDVDFYGQLKEQGNPVVVQDLSQLPYEW